MRRFAWKRSFRGAGVLVFLLAAFATTARPGRAATTAAVQRLAPGIIAHRVAIPGIWSELVDPRHEAPDAFAVGNLLVIVAAEDPLSVTAFDQNGKQIWKIPLANELGGFNLQGGDLLFTAPQKTEDGPTSIFDVDLATGKTRWTRVLKFPGILATDARGTVVSASKGLVAFDRAGKKLWDVASATIDRRLFFADDLIVALGSIPGADDEPERGAYELSSYHRSDGSEIAREEIPDDVTFRGTHALLQFDNPEVKGFPSPGVAEYPLGCCAISRVIVDLRLGRHAGQGKPEFVTTSDAIAPDARANVALSNHRTPCPEIPPPAVVPGIFAAGGADVFFVGAAHRIYALDPSGIRGAALNDTCLTSLGSIGATTVAWHSGALALLSNGAHGLSLVPLDLPLYSGNVIASFTGAARFYFSTATSLYGIDPTTGRERVWPVSCPYMAEPTSSSPSKLLECGRANGKLEVLDLK